MAVYYIYRIKENIVFHYIYLF